MISVRYNGIKDFEPLEFLFEIFADDDLVKRCSKSTDPADLGIKVSEILIEKTLSPTLQGSFGKVWGDSLVSAGVLNEGEEIGNLSFLSEKEKDIIGFFYGFKDGKNYSLEDTSDKVGLTRERVRQIKENAMKRIRNYYVGKGINFPVKFFRT